VAPIIFMTEISECHHNGTNGTLPDVQSNSSFRSQCYKTFLQA
jgi:hypothetical protein